MSDDRRQGPFAGYRVIDFGQYIAGPAVAASVDSDLPLNRIRVLDLTKTIAGLTITASLTLFHMRSTPGYFESYNHMREIRPGAERKARLPRSFGRG